MQIEQPSTVAATAVYTIGTQKGTRTALYPFLLPMRFQKAILVRYEYFSSLRTQTVRPFQFFSGVIQARTRKKKERSKKRRKSARSRLHQRVRCVAFFRTENLSKISDFPGIFETSLNFQRKQNIGSLALRKHLNMGFGPTFQSTSIFQTRLLLAKYIFSIKNVFASDRQSHSLQA